MTIDDEIGDAFVRLADRAPDPIRVRAGLGRAAQMHRQRRALLAAGGLVVAGGLAGGGVLAARLVLGGTDFGPDVPTPGNLPTPAAAPPAPGNSVVPMRYRPTWLPDGFVELGRSTTVAAGLDQLRQRRAWYPVGTTLDPLKETPPSIYLDLVPATWWGIADWRTPVRVNGARGGLGPSGSTPVLLWEAGGGLNLAVSVNGGEDNRATALAIGRSVVPDGVSTVEVALSFGWLPALPGALVRYETGPDRTRLEVIVGQFGVITFDIDGQEDPGVDYQTEPVTVRGASGRWFRNGTAVMLWLTLPDGRPLVGVLDRVPARGVTLTDDDVLHIVSDLSIGPRPANTWIGSR
ncbi:MAG TPA: hypothetical protein VH561_19570 [Micromonosporaceae bacterium]|jgi:hypothetical protein